MHIRWPPFLWAMVVLVGFGALAITRVPAGASEDSTTTSIANVKYDRSCEKSSGTESQIQLDECAYKELNEVRGQLRSELAVEASQFGTPSVTAVQARWHKYLIANCNTFSGAKGGTAHPMFVDECELDLTINRLIDVRESLTFNPIGH